jgi:O-antigen ligase
MFIAAIVVAGGMTTIGLRIADATLFTSGSGFQRLFTLGLALDVLKSNILFGIGFLRFSEVVSEGGASMLFDAVKISGQFAESYVANASNQYLQSGLDAGIAGVVALVLLLVRSATTCLAEAREDDGVLAPFLMAGFAWIVGLALGNQSAVWILPGSLLFCVFCVVLGLAAGVRIRRSSSDLSTARP